MDASLINECEHENIPQSIETELYSNQLLSNHIKNNPYASHQLNIPTLPEHSLYENLKYKGESPHIFPNENDKDETYLNQQNISICVQHNNLECKENILKQCLQNDGVNIKEESYVNYQHNISTLDQYTTQENLEYNEELATTPVPNKNNDDVTKEKEKYIETSVASLSANRDEEPDIDWTVTAAVECDVDFDDANQKLTQNLKKNETLVKSSTISYRSQIHSVAGEENLNKIGRHIIQRITKQPPHRTEKRRRKSSKKEIPPKASKLPTNEKRYQCNLCDKKFNVKDHYNQHFRTHTGEKPFKCDSCDKRFNQKGHINRHMRIHTGIKPFKCPQCGKDFGQKEHYLRHIRTHSGEKPIKCNLCEKRFSHKAHFDRHMRTHTGEKPFKCQYCDKCFSRTDVLGRHVKSHMEEKTLN